MKKLSKIFIALFMVLTLVTPSAVFAAETVTITNTPATTGLTIAGREFAAYKLFDINSVSGSGEDTIVSYTIDGDFLKYFQDNAKVSTDYNNLTGSAKADETKKALDHITKFEGGLQAFAKELVKNLPAKADSTSNARDLNAEGKEVVTFANLENGYYLFKDNSASVDGKNDAIVASALINSYDGAADDKLNINIKGSKPSIEKQIKDNDSTADDPFGDVADYQIGDSIDFKITAKLPTNTEGYKSYTYKIVDNMTAGLKFNDDLTIEGLTKGKDYTVTNVSGTGFTVTLVDLLTNPTFEDISEIVLTYTATLTSDAEIATDFDKNDVTLIYSNNPYTESEGEQTDTVFNYTFKGDFLKTDGGNNPLGGAEFTLYEADGTTQIPLSVKDGNVYYPAYNGSTLANTTGIIITDAENHYGEFDIVGLDDNKTYILRETKAPDGYNAAADIIIKFDAEYNEDGTLTGLAKVEPSTVDVSVDKSGVIGTIINTSATLLPETGGVGTVMFSVVGVSVMVAAAVLIIKGRKEENTDC